MMAVRAGPSLNGRFKPAAWSACVPVQWRAAAQAPSIDPPENSCRTWVLLVGSAHATACVRPGVLAGALPLHRSAPNSPLTARLPPGAAGGIIARVRWHLTPNEE
jgi:hypothetical protein